MRTTYLDIDLSKLYKHTGSFVPDLPLELKLIEGFMLYGNDEETVIDEFTNIVLQSIYNDKLNRPYEEIHSFYKESEYISKIFLFLNKLEILILNNVKPDIINIRFKQYIEKTANKLIVTFEVTENDRKIIQAKT
jgi:hypothetical protein